MSCSALSPSGCLGCTRDKSALLRARPRKLRIAHFAAGGKVRSLRCSSFPQQSTSCFPGGPIRLPAPHACALRVTLRRRRDARLPSGAGLKQSRNAALRFRALAPVHPGCAARLRASAHKLDRGRTVWMDGGGVRKTRFFRRPCINPAAPWENHSTECRVLRGL